MLRTSRLILRPWDEDDLPAFARLCSDEDVMAHFPKLLNRDESYAMGRTISNLIRERGWGFWAVEIPQQEKFIGFVGLHKPKDTLPCAPCVEIGWRLAKAYWGQGYASEAANAALDYAFTTLNLDEVVSFTTLANTPSKAVMRKIGMRDSKQNFMHPDLDPTHPQCEHVLYKINKSTWRNLKST